MSLLLDNSKLSPFTFARSILSKLSNKDLLLALIVIIVWGLNFVVIKVGVADVPPFLLAGLRFLFVVFPLAFFLKAPKIPLKIYLLYGLAISFGQFSFLFTAIASGMPSGLASLVLQSQAFFTLIFSFYSHCKWICFYNAQVLYGDLSNQFCSQQKNGTNNHTYFLR